MTSPTPDPQTPLTDAQVRVPDIIDHQWVPADFARTLERELTATREQLEEMRKERDALLIDVERARDGGNRLYAAIVERMQPHFADADRDLDWDVLPSTIAARLSRLDRAEAALKECAKERLQLIEGCVHAETELGKFKDQYFDEDPPEGCRGCPEGEFIRHLMAHLSGTCIGDDGEFMPRDKYDAALTNNGGGKNS